MSLLLCLLLLLLLLLLCLLLALLDLTTAWLSISLPKAGLPHLLQL
jgi:hypothetical protein